MIRTAAATNRPLASALSLLPLTSDARASALLQFVAGAMEDHDVYNEENLTKVPHLTRPDLPQLVGTHLTPMGPHLSPHGTSPGQVFAKLDTDGSGTLCPREIVVMMGDDHEFSREMLAQIAASRGSDASELSLTVEDFKQLMMQSVSAPPTVTASKTRGKRRRDSATAEVKA